MTPMPSGDLAALFGSDQVMDVHGSGLLWLLWSQGQQGWDRGSAVGGGPGDKAQGPGVQGFDSFFFFNLVFWGGVMGPRKSVPAVVLVFFLFFFFEVEGTC